MLEIAEERDKSASSGSFGELPMVASVVHRGHSSRGVMGNVELERKIKRRAFFLRVALGFWRCYDLRDRREHNGGNVELHDVG